MKNYLQKWFKNTDLNHLIISENLGKNIEEFLKK